MSIPYISNRTALFVDGSNNYAAVKRLGFDVDYTKFLQYFKEKHGVTQAYYFSAVLQQRNGHEPIRDFLNMLQVNDYNVVDKEAKVFDGYVKGNMDIEIAVYMLDMTSTYTHMILVTGDGDFRILVDALQRKGVRVTVVSTIKTNPPMLSDSLRKQANSFIDLYDLKPEIERVQCKKPKTS